MKFVFDQSIVESLGEQEKSCLENNEDLTFQLSGKTSAGDFRAFTTNYMIDLTKSLESLKLLPGLVEKLDTNLANHTHLLGEFNALKTKVGILETDLQDKNEEVEELTTKVNSLELELNQLKLTVNKNRSDSDREIEKLQADLQKGLSMAKSKNVELERYTRSFNLRLMKLPEGPREKTPETIRLIDQVIEDITGKDIRIEYGHRTGAKSDEGPRGVVFRLFSRQEKYELLNDRKKFFAAGLPLYEDLPPEDLQEKKKYSELMTEKWRAKKKVTFRQGYWYVDGKKFTGDPDA